MHLVSNKVYGKIPEILSIVERMLELDKEMDAALADLSREDRALVKTEVVKLIQERKSNG